MKKFKNNIALLAISLSIFALCSDAEGSQARVRRGFGNTAAEKKGLSEVRSTRETSAAEQMENLKKLSCTTYTVQSTPKIVIQQLKGQSISLDSMIVCKGLTLNSKSYNGIQMKQPLIIDANMTCEEIYTALVKSFGYGVTTSTK